MLDTWLQPVTILYKGTAAGPGGPSEGQEATQFCPLGHSWPSTPWYTACQDEMLTPSAGETPAPRNKRLNLLHKLGHRSGRGRGEAQGMLNSLFWLCWGPAVFRDTITQENILLGRPRPDNKSGREAWVPSLLVPT